MKKIIYSIALLCFVFQMQAQKPLTKLLHAKDWRGISPRQLPNLKVEHKNYDLILIPEKKARTFWGDIIKLDTQNNYRNYRGMRCGTPPYSTYDIIGKWQVENNTLSIDVQSAKLDCTYDEEECEKREQNFLKIKEETKIKYALEVVNNSLIIGMKQKLKLSDSLVISENKSKAKSNTNEP